MNFIYLIILISHFSSNSKWFTGRAFPHRGLSPPPPFTLHHIVLNQVSLETHSGWHIMYNTEARRVGHKCCTISSGSTVAKHSHLVVRAKETFPLEPPFTKSTQLPRSLVCSPGQGIPPPPSPLSSCVVARMLLPFDWFLQLCSMESWVRRWECQASFPEGQLDHHHHPWSSPEKSNWRKCLVCSKSEGGIQLVCTGSIEPDPKLFWVWRTGKNATPPPRILASSLVFPPLLSDQVPNAAFWTWSERRGEEGRKTAAQTLAWTSFLPFSPKRGGGGKAGS